ncbi:hypothetical protein SAMN05446037_100680 [Anaerovirgula multivorans]|uniref:Uncharacterized protein n=1 Tax=Anaerovirgula multivorans TaxID=312168 RepID=A0A239CNX8_9FIRM|nr:hypothetical protein [Anaerovirgula multivorans]SNS21966.1 hypothetical protein SAMN05446037_100680 [Anaerovirgula multivorans]
MEKTKAQLEKEHSEKINKEAVAKVKEEVLTQAEADRMETIFFEDDAKIRLRDGKFYRVHPSTLGDARRIMRLVKVVNLDVILANFLPDEKGNDPDLDNLYELLLIAFRNYQHVDADYLDKYVDLAIAQEIVEVILNINGIVTKK